MKVESVPKTIIKEIPVEVEPEPVDKAALQRPALPVFLPGHDANTDAANLARLQEWVATSLDSYVDGLESLILCRANRECDHE